MPFWSFPVVCTVISQCITSQNCLLCTAQNMFNAKGALVVTENNNRVTLAPVWQVRQREPITEVGPGAPTSAIKKTVSEPDRVSVLQNLAR